MRRPATHWDANVTPSHRERVIRMYPPYIAPCYGCLLCTARASTLLREKSAHSNTRYAWHACQTLPVPLRARKTRAPTRNGMRQILLNLAKPIYHLHWRPRSTRKEAARAIANIKQTYVAYSLGIHLIRCFS